MTFSEKRAKALEKKIKNTDKNKSRVIAPMDFNPQLPKLSEVLAKHFKAMIFRKPELKETFSDPPMVALRQPPNLRKLICKSTLPQQKRSDKLVRKSHRQAPGWRKCGEGTTTCCPYALPPTSEVTGQVTGFKHKIKESVTCESENCV